MLITPNIVTSTARVVIVAVVVMLLVMVVVTLDVGCSKPASKNE